jgi:hypothetical protein
VLFDKLHKTVGTMKKKSDSFLFLKLVKTKRKQVTLLPTLSVTRTSQEILDVSVDEV